MTISEDLAQMQKKVYQYLLQDRFQNLFRPEHARMATFSYPRRPGKGLRGTGCIWACGAASTAKRTEEAIPAAAAVEMHHMWSLVHDDIMDLDTVRRGGPTVHYEYMQIARDEWGYSDVAAERYGNCIGILAGDAGIGLVYLLFCQLFKSTNIKPEVVQLIIAQFSEVYVPLVMEGQTLDIQYEGIDISQLSDEDMLHVSRLKTGTTFGLGGFSGSLIGLDEPDPEHENVKLLTRITENAGMVLQLTDDLLNISGEESITGKSVGSDVLLGKKTIPIVHAFHRANEKERAKFLSQYGNITASREELRGVLDLIRQLGGIEYTRKLIDAYMSEAYDSIAMLPESRYKELLEAWLVWISTRIK